MSKLKAQGSIFDSLIFLLIASITSTVLLTSASNFGTIVSKSIDVNRITLYLQNAHKSLYFIGINSTFDEDINVEINGERYSCSDLKKFGDISPYICLKEDLFDKKLDNKGGSCGIVSILALKCAYKKIFKPLSLGGYIYVVELIDNQNNNLLRNFKISNADYSSCEDIGEVDRVAMIFPFRVLTPKDKNNNGIIDDSDIIWYKNHFIHDIDDYKIKICVTTTPPR